MADIKETKELVSFVIALVNGLGKALEDGKVGIADVLDFTEAFQKAGAAVENISAVIPEIRYMTELQRNELYKLVDTLDLPGEMAEQIIEKAIKAGVLLAELAIGLIPQKQQDVKKSK